LTFGGNIGNENKATVAVLVRFLIRRLNNKEEYETLPNFQAPQRKEPTPNQGLRIYFPIQ
jgi:hypothetical protein